MRFLKKCSVFCFLLANAITLSACSGSSAKQDATTDNIVPQKKENVQQVVTQANSELQAELNKAKKSGKAVFLVVTGIGVTETDKALTIAKNANLINRNTVVLQMNRDEAENAELVAQWRLAGAPLPLILVLSSKGQPTGGMVLAQATPENIAALVPSPKLEMVYEAIGNKKNAIVVFSRKSFTDRDEVVQNSKKAVDLLKNEAVFIEVDMDDSNEIGFMKQVRINKNNAKASITLVINKQGQVAGTSLTVPDVSKLVAAANTPVKSGCGPGCGPAGCEK